MPAPRAAMLAFASVLLPAAAAAQTQALRHDPFAAPWRAPTETAGAAAGDARPAVPPWTPQLKAVLLAGKASMVNVNGEMLRIGDHIDGYRLAEVRQDGAVFMKGGHQVVVSMDGAPPAAGRAATEKP